MKINEKSLYVFASSVPYDYHGFLNKRGEINKSFLRHYFVLKGNLLFYFEKQDDKEPLGLIIVEGCTIELSEDCEQYCFELAFNGMRTYVLSADSQNTMESWMQALTCAGHEYKKVLVAELQRKLQEVESSSRRIIEKSVPCSLVNSYQPARRQNPFNRQAPVLTFPQAYSYNNSVIINGHLEINANKGSDLKVRPSERLPFDNNEHDLNMDIRVGANIIPFPAKSMQSSKVLNFEQLHEKFRQLILEDITKYHTNSALETKPLIEI